MIFGFEESSAPAAGAGEEEDGDVVLGFAADILEVGVLIVRSGLNIAAASSTLLVG